MSSIVLHYCEENLDEACALCERPLRAETGLQLVHAEQMRPVCAACGRRAAPELAALQGLASEAERVGRINSFTVMPPLTVLLELSRAAERYTSALCPRSLH